MNLPLQGVATSGPQDYESWLQKVDLGYLSALSRGIEFMRGSYHFCNHVLGALAMKNFHDCAHLQSSLPQQFDTPVRDFDTRLIPLSFRFTHSFHICFRSHNGIGQRRGRDT